jgi:hypothetical protein
MKKGKNGKVSLFRSSTRVVPHLLRRRRPRRRRLEDGEMKTARRAKGKATHRLQPRLVNHFLIHKRLNI